MTDFDIKVYIITQTALGEFDRLLEDTLYALREIAHGTRELNRYRYIEEHNS